MSGPNRDNAIEEVIEDYKNEGSYLSDEEIRAEAEDIVDSHWDQDEDCFSL